MIKTLFRDQPRVQGPAALPGSTPVRPKQSGGETDWWPADHLPGARSLYQCEFSHFFI